MDAIPILSQVKSLVQLMEGDEEGAAETQRNFTKICPGVSQVRSAVQLATGDVDGALETQKAFSGILDSVPVVGHAKGLVHYAFDDMEGGHAAVKAATRSTGTAIGGTVGFCLGGPAGAFAGGMYGSVATDTGLTGLSLAVNGEEKAEAYGTLGLVRDIVEKDGKASSTLDLAGTLVFDGLSGVSYGETLGRRKRVKVNVDEKIKKKVNDPAAIKKLQSDGKKMTGNTLRNMPAEIEHFQAEKTRIESNSGLSRRQMKRQTIAAKQNLLHTDSGFHQLYQDDHLHGCYAADVVPSGQADRGSNRMIFRDDKRNYNLTAKAYSTGHYRDVAVNPANPPGRYTRACNAYADLPGKYHAGVEVVSATRRHERQKKRRHHQD